MDIQRKEFEEWAKANGYHVAKNPIGEVYLSLNCNSAWKAWQAAKAQAVPEANALLGATLDAVQKLGSGDFVLVPREPTYEMLEAGSEARSRTDGHIASIWEAMIEAQE